MPSVYSATEVLLEALGDIRCVARADPRERQPADLLGFDAAGAVEVRVEDRSLAIDFSQRSLSGVSGSESISLITRSLTVMPQILAPSNQPKAPV